MLFIAKSFPNKNPLSTSKIHFRVIFRSLKYPQAWLVLLVEGRVTRKSWKEKKEIMEGASHPSATITIAIGCHWGHVKPVIQLE